MDKDFSAGSSIGDKKQGLVILTISSKILNLLWGSALGHTTYVSSVVSFQYTEVVLPAQRRCTVLPFCAVKYRQKGGDRLDVLSRIKTLMEARGWTAYRLASEAGLTESTIQNLFRRNGIPTLPTLEAVCSAFGITLSQFFADDDMMECTPEIKRLMEAWTPLTQEQKEAYLKLMELYQNAQ